MSVTLTEPEDFAAWRAQARALVAAGIAPANAGWGDAGLFDDAPGKMIVGNRPVSVPAAFLPLAQTLFMHRSPARLPLLYRLLWRVQTARHLLGDASDADVADAAHMVKAVRRDIHKMRAFVRFRAVSGEDGRPHYVSWFEPDHRIVIANAGFFARRFATMRWSILTPDACLHWDEDQLTTTPGIARPEAGADDPAEALWTRYYASIFNPARLKTKAMLKEMPRRYWKNMPETRQIPALIASAQAREAAMIENGAAPADLPPADWSALASGIAACTRCPLACGSGRPVPGEGPPSAALMLVGEQPGDSEEQQGRPFIGPAGQVLDTALEAAGVARTAAYITNAVKHFKHRQTGKVRLHVTPSAREIDHCRWWLDAERALVRPRVIVALGASAARGLTGRTVNIEATRGQAIPLGEDATLIVSYHPAAILRTGEASRATMAARLADDLRLADALSRAVCGSAPAPSPHGPGGR